MKTWVILPLLLLAPPLMAQSSTTGVVGAHPGYVFDVEKEKNSHDTELVLIPEPEKPKPLKDKLFDEKMTKDIREQFEYRFGHTAMEQGLNAPSSRDSEFYYKGDTTVTADKYIEYQRSFGEYVGRRVMENQVDNFFKSDPELKSVYQFKDRVSNVAVETKSGYKFKWRYNIAGNSMDVDVENPYHVTAKAQMQFRQFSTETEEETVSLGYQINKLYSVTGYYKFYDALVQLVGTRRITSSVAATLSGSTTTNDGMGPSIRQNQVIVGLSWTQ